MTHSIGTPLLWAGFTVVVLVLLALDLFVFHRKAHEVKVKEALIWSAVWISLALGFAGFVWLRAGQQPALEYLTGYVIEKALSVDNLFVFVIVFAHFGVPAKDQHRVLFWGVLGALVMRALFIGLGAALLTRFHWVAYVFGAFLVITGIKLIWQRDDDPDPEAGFILRTVRRIAPNLPKLALVLIVVETTDLVFAVDSIPAIFAVTQDPFIVYTSNIFAIMGLRSLYFALAGVMGRFHYIKLGLALVLGFVGVKMLISGIVHVPVTVSLGVIVLLIGGSVVASLAFPPQGKPRTEP
ncbi:MAG: TerC family protein [Myxococcaceae bacterium]|nr:TerC family protein [Myxococcaceae bacterium]